MMAPVRVTGEYQAQDAQRGGMGVVFMVWGVF